MITATVPATASRIAALGLLAGVIALVVLAGLLPAWHKYRDNNSAIAEHLENIARFESVGANLEVFDAALGSLESERERNPNLLKQESTALAAAGLQQLLKTIVEGVGGKLASASMQPAVEDGTLKRVTVRVRISVSTAALQNVLYTLESAVPYLLVENLAIVSRAARRRSTRKIIPQLDVRFDLSGFMRAGAG